MQRGRAREKEPREGEVQDTLRGMRALHISVLLALSTQVSQVADAAQETFFPPAGTWPLVEPAERERLGFDLERLDAAVRLAISREAATPTDLRAYIAATLANEPHGEIVGPVKDRGPATGLVVRGGHLVARWGDPDRVDMTFSVTKTYLSTVVGVAFDRGLVPDLDAPVARLVPTEHFAGENAAVTWDHLLRQTSDWRGELWGKYDWADRPPRGVALEELPNQPRTAPGTTWKYNDVRVNLLAFAALQVWREPLPVVLRREVLDPIGASPTWRWHGYETSWVELDGLRMQSVSGGGHWGGGMWISSWDQARFGLLFENGGVWDGRRLVSERWIELARTPTEVRRGYGFMNWFLNTDRRPLPSAPADAVTFRGAGANIVYVDRANDLVIVLRWIDGGHLDEVIGGFLGALVD